MALLMASGMTTSHTTMSQHMAKFSNISTLKLRNHGGSC